MINPITVRLSSLHPDRLPQTPLPASSGGDPLVPGTENDSATTTSEKVQRGLQVAQTIKDINAASRDNRKKLAKQRLEMAKQELQVLKMMGGNALKVAGQATEIAGKVARAARDYGDAARTGSGDVISLSSAAGSALATADLLKDPEVAKALSEASQAQAKQKAEQTDNSDGSTEKSSGEASGSEGSGDRVSNDNPTGWQDDRKFDATPDGKFFVEARDLLKKIRKVVDESHRNVIAKHGMKAEKAFGDVAKALQESEKMLVQSRNDVKNDTQTEEIPQPLLRISI